MSENEEVCGETIDLYPNDPGHFVYTCARKPHSKRAWHKTADEDFAWKTQKVKLSLPTVDA